MSRAAEDLALRKEIAIARSSLCRLKIRYQASVLRQSVSLRALGASVAHSPPAREAALLLVAEVVGRHRVGRWLAFAVRALAIAKMTSLAISLLRGPPAEKADRQPP
jgi:hypothetical protein